MPMRRRSCARLAGVMRLMSWPRMMHLPARGLHRHEQQPQQRRLARAGRAGEEVERARPQMKGDVTQHLGAARIFQTNGLQPDHGLSRPPAQAGHHDPFLRKLGNGMHRSGLWRTDVARRYTAVPRGHANLLLRSWQRQGIRIWQIPCSRTETDRDRLLGRGHRRSASASWRKRIAGRAARAAAGRIGPERQLRFRRRPGARPASRGPVARGRFHVAVELPLRPRPRRAGSRSCAISRPTWPAATC